jgi:hypothetical protein
MTSLDRTIVGHFRDLMSRQGIRVAETVVFGSRARGDATQDSDLDVLVVVEQLSPALREQISHCAWEAGFGPEVLIQPVVMTRDEAQTSPQRSSLFMMAVRQEGVPV